MIRLVSASIMLFCILLLVFVQSFIFVDGQILTNITQSNNSYNNSGLYIPSTISKKAQEELSKIMFEPQNFRSPDPGDIEGWKKLNLDSESYFIERSKPILDLYQPNISETDLGGVQVVDIKPRNWIDNGKVLVYTHGGAYTFGSANSNLAGPVLVANATGLRIVSINYTVAPFSKWNQTTDEVLSVIRALKDDQGYSNDNIAMFGDSAGGGLAAGSVLKMRDLGLGLPAALILWSPWLDLTGSGDTYFTLRNADPFLSYDTFLKNAADAYADPADQRNPYASPVYANFSEGYIPTLIQGGTKEILLSDFVRLYQALDQNGIPVRLDIYEGMPHVFQTSLYNTTESNVAILKTNAFLKEYLNN
jgi:epsilon-lactone hydrolase